MLAMFIELLLWAVPEPIAGKQILSFNLSGIPKRWAFLLSPFYKDRELGLGGMKAQVSDP